MRRACFIGAVIIAAIAGDAAQAEIGVLAAVNRDMTGARPTEQARPIFIKEKLVQDERIISTNGGGGQVLFLDQTSLTIAPNSEVVLDKYVYDPETDSGEMTVSVLRGAMRFVGGRISKSEPATIRTPSATIGIRGGMGNINVQEGAETFYMHVAGFSSTITSGDQQLTITREGGLASIGANGDLQYLGIADSDFISNAFRPEAVGRGDGGSLAASVTSTVNEATNQVTEIVSAEPDAVVQAAISTIGEKQTLEFGELTIEVQVELETEFSEQTLMINEELGGDPPVVTDFDSFLATGLFTNTVLSEGLSSTDPNAFFQLIYNGNANEGVVFFSIPDTGDALTEIDGDQFSGFGDQFLVRLGAEGQFSGNTGLATILLGDPSNSNFTLNEASSTLDGDISVDYANSTLVDFLQSSNGSFTDAQVQFIQSFIEPGVDQATLQAELDQGLAEFRAVLQPLP